MKNKSTHLNGNIFDQGRNGRNIKKAERRCFHCGLLKAAVMLGMMGYACNPSTGEAGGSLGQGQRVSSHSELHSEFKVSPGHIVRPCLNTTTTKQQCVTQGEAGGPPLMSKVPVSSNCPCPVSAVRRSLTNTPGNQRSPPQS